jgi:ABC-2 type transport system ATP-binding protein
MLTTLLNPTNGKIKVNGFDPVEEKHEVRKSFGIVFQDPSLDNELTAYENLDFHGSLYGMDEKSRKERIESLLKFVGLRERKSDYVKSFSGVMIICSLILFIIGSYSFNKIEI